MLRKALYVVIVAFMLHSSPVRADECISVDSFVTEFAKEGIAFRGSTAAATEKLSKVFNENRATAGSPKVEVSLFLFGPVKNTAGDIVVVAAAVDKNGCVMPKTVGILTLREFSTFATRAGITPKDLIPMDGA